MHANTFQNFVLAIQFMVMLVVAAQPSIAQETRDSDGGYIDPARLRNQIRFRFDAAYDNPVPDRAEFFYPQLGQGLPNPERRVDYQETEAYLESVLSPKLSVFAEIPVRFINPTDNLNAAGLSDIRAGIKYSIIDYDNRQLTFQLRTFFPSGNGSRGLGTNHYSLEPGLLYQWDRDQLRTFGELKAWIPIDPSTITLTNNNQNNQIVNVNFGGPILRYGLGYSYDLLQNKCYFQCLDCGELHESVGNRLSFVNEFVGWTILDGLKTDFDTNAAGNTVLNSAAGDTVINLKLGLRWTRPGDTLYVGYGRALTGDVWYKDLLRAEYALRF